MFNADGDVVGGAAAAPPRARRSDGRMLAFLLVACLGGSPSPVSPALATVPAPAPAPAPVVEAPPEPPAFPGAPPIAPCGAAPEGMGCVPGGPMLRGSDLPHACAQQKSIPADHPNHAPAAMVWVQTFWMDRTEVTYAAYKACVAEKKCTPGGPAYSDFDRPTQPIVGVSWFMAKKFCEAHGKHLPTEAEWEKAARGPDGDTFPWGEDPATCERAVLMDERGRSCGVPKAGTPEKGRVLEVPARPEGRYGLSDMSGNAEEWVADWYARDYAACGEACRGVDPKGPCGGAATCEGYDRRVVKGGSWYWDASHVTGYHRRSHIPANDVVYHHFGFRCAASVDEAAKLASSAP